MKFVLRKGNLNKPKLLSLHVTFHVEDPTPPPKKIMSYWLVLRETESSTWGGEISAEVWLTKFLLSYQEDGGGGKTHQETQISSYSLSISLLDGFFSPCLAEGNGNERQSGVWYNCASFPTWKTHKKKKKTSVRYSHHLSQAHIDTQTHLQTFLKDSSFFPML